jgi:hypothetical protein
MEQRCLDHFQKNGRPSVPFDRNGSDLDKCAPVVAISPVSSVSVPIAFVIAVPIFVIPIVVTAIVVRSDGERGANYCPEG